MKLDSGDDSADLELETARHGKLQNLRRLYPVAEEEQTGRGRNPEGLMRTPQNVVKPPETANALENRPVEDPPQSRFTWRIENLFRLNTKKLYSEIFVVGGYKWRVLIFPKGNNVDHLSMYLDVADSSSLPYGWSGYAEFSLGVVNQIQSKYSVRKVSGSDEGSGDRV